MACNEDGCSVGGLPPVAGRTAQQQQLIERIVRKVVAELTYGPAPASGGEWLEGVWILEEVARSMIQNGAARVSACSSSGCATRLAPDLAGNIDHTLLKPDASPEMVEKLCREAMQHRFASVCVNPVMWIIVPGIFRVHRLTSVRWLDFRSEPPRPQRKPSKQRMQCAGGRPRSIW